MTNKPNKGDSKMSDTKIEINGIEYVRADSVQKAAEPVDGMRLVFVRSVVAGVHAGYVAEQRDRYIRLVRSRWIRDYAADNLHSLATVGATDVSQCNYTDEIPEIEICEDYVVIPMTEAGRKSYEQVGPWRK
jgi:hypothetical protein